MTMSSDVVLFSGFGDIYWLKGESQLTDHDKMVEFNLKLTCFSNKSNNLWFFYIL